MVDKINLSVDAESLEQFCQKLIKCSRDIAKTHDALDFDKAGIDIEEYHAMLDVSRYLENRDTH